MIQLRSYQEQAIQKIIWSKSRGLRGNELCVLPTGAGKSIVIAELANQLEEPILILQPSKEILEQNLEKLLRYVDRSDVGIYSASMDEKTIGHYTFATIQSIYKKPEFFSKFKLILLDEAHLLNPKSLTGMFSSFLNKIGNPKTIGFTATPYRQDTMYKKLGDNPDGGVDYEMRASTKLINRMASYVDTPHGREFNIFWSRVLYNINVSDLISQGYLCPLEYHDHSIVRQQDIPLNKAETDFDMEAYEMLISRSRTRILSTVEYAKSVSNSVLVFCSSVRQAEALSEDTPGSYAISAKTPKKEREFIIESFKNGSVKTVFNVGVLTTGFDHPALDCIILNRPTRSIALYYQMLGRGVRTAPGKTNCKVIDLTSTVKNLGRVETIKLVKKEYEGKLQWTLESETNPQWHGTELYDFTFTKQPKKSKFSDVLAAMQ